MPLGPTLPSPAIPRRARTTALALNHLQALAEVLVTSDSRRRLGWFSDAWNDVSDWVVDGVEATGDALVSAAEGVAEFIGNAADAFLTPIRALISTIETQMENLLGQLTSFFRQAIEGSLSALSKMGEEAADRFKTAMLTMLRSCVTQAVTHANLTQAGWNPRQVGVPTCLIGPPGGCSRNAVWERSWNYQGNSSGNSSGNSPMWESMQMQLTVSHFHSCCG